ncbi:MAG: ATP-dependent zinc metalloprotease FtsH [Actinomycetota bacterium]|nr:ATP-dependent zinc metalloprotease FtsH [Actinomycetota bacterium]
MAERSTTTAGTQPLAGLKKRFDDWNLRRRRRNSAKRKSTGRRTTIALSVIVLLLFAAFAASLRYLTPKPEGLEISIDQLSALADEKRIETAEFRDEDNHLVGTFLAESLEPEEPGKAKGDGDKGAGAKGGEGNGAGGAGSAAGGKGKAAGGNDGGARADAVEEEPSVAPIGEGTYWLAYPSSDAAFGVLAEVVTAAGATVTVDPQTSKTIVRAVSTYLLPLLILASFFGLLFTAGKGGGSAIGEVMTFGSMDKKGKKGGKASATTFADVGGAEEAVIELKEVVDYLTNPKRYEEIGAVPPKGVLLFGPPGCGKTLLAKAVAGEAGVPFFSVAGAEFVESLVGVGAARVRDLFARVRAVAPAIVFIDELDAAGRKRGHGEGGGSDEREQTLNQMLVEMDGFEVSAGLVVIGATNRPDILDPALLRPGRFDRHITVDQPDAAGRKAILELHAKGKPMAVAVDLGYIAKRTPGFSGADLANVINEAALLTLREGKPTVETPELEEAIQRVLHGPKRRGRVLTPEEERRAAYHESGHAIVAAALGRADDLHRVSILARARGIGGTGLERQDETLLLTRDQIFARVVVAMAGMAAEELVLGEPSTGAENDLEQATDLVRDIVGRYGMSPALGRARLLIGDVDQYLGGESAFANLSDQTHVEFDNEVRRLLSEAETQARRLLDANRSALNEMAERLEVDETLEGAPLEEILHKVPRSDVALGTIFTSRDGNGRATAATAARTAGKK